MAFTSKKKLSPDDFRALAASLGKQPTRARKAVLIAARPADPGERVETRWNGAETVNAAEPGDWVVTTLDEDRQALRDDDGCVNTYIVPAGRFDELYAPTRGETEFGAVYRSKGEVLALYLPGGFDILAPWGERQRADRGYLLLNGDEVYGNHADTFNATYKKVRARKR